MRQWLVMTLIITVPFLSMGCIEHELPLPNNIVGKVLDSETKLPIEGVQVSVDVINRGVGVLGPEGTVGKRVWLEKVATTDSQGKFSISLEGWKREMGEATIQGLTISELRIQKEGYIVDYIKYSNQVAVFLIRKS